jgi:hypothetical protein
MDERSVSQRKFENTILVISIILLFGLGAYYYVANWVARNIDFGIEMCGNTIFQEIGSPDDEYKVVVFERNCGATTGFSTQISILYESEELPNESGNIFTMDGHPDSSKVVATWVDNQTVNISYNAGYDVYSNEVKYRGISKDIDIQYFANSNY